LTPKGVRVDAARIEGQLDLGCVTVPFPIELWRCAIVGGINLQRADTRFLSFEGCYTGTIAGAGLVVHGDVHLRNGFYVKGEVGLKTAKISGDLVCDGGIFLSYKGAINAEGATVGGKVSLRDGFRAEGEVNLYRAEIGSDLACDKGVFQNPGARALNAGGVKVGGQISLRDVKVQGQINLYRAEIGSDLACDGGTFATGEHDHPTLAAGGVTVGGQVSLRDGFRAKGEVGLYGAKISGDLACDGGIFLNPGKRALNAGRVTVGGTVLLRKSSRPQADGFRAEGEVGLYGANISGDLLCDGGVFLNVTGRALAARGVTLGGQVSLRDGFQAESEVGLYGAKIGGDLTCDGGIFLNPGKRALNAGRVTVGGAVLLRKSSQPQTEGFRAQGEVGLYEARITGMLDWSGGVFLNPGEDNYALNARAIVVGSDAFLRNSFRAEGLVRLVGAEIGTHPECRNARFFGKPSNGLIAEKTVVKGLFDWREILTDDDTILDLWGARVGQLADDERSWPRQGKLDLDDFVYTAIASGPMDKDQRVGWLERQAAQPLDPHFGSQISTATQFRPKAYQQLAKVLRESGQEGEATRVLIEKEEARGRYGNLPWLGNWILGKTMAHGYRPQRLLVGALVVCPVRRVAI
jgi:hypothetical protein